MDEREREKMRGNIRTFWASDDIELTDAQVEICLQARLKTQRELAQGGAQELRDRWPKAMARAAKEGRTFEDVLAEERRGEHKAYWDAKRAQQQSLPKGES